MNDGIVLGGIHHITAICASPVENVDFYQTVLGLRLVKQTENFDDPHTYHLYWGDEQGRPGTILTFFPWQDMPRGKNGAGMVVATAYAIDADAVGYWLDRLETHGIAVEQVSRFGEQVLCFQDPHGTRLELVGTAGAGANDDGAGRHRLKGLHSATALVNELTGGEQALLGMLGLQPAGREDRRHRFAFTAGNGLGGAYDLLVDPGAAGGRQGSGSVHHIAFRVRDDALQKVWRQKLELAGYEVSAVLDRNYFHSIYFREPGRVLFEIATDPPGFAVDEPAEALGRSLMLPPWYEGRRAEIERHLPPLPLK